MGFPVLALAVPLLVALGYWATVRLGGVVDLSATSGRACVVSTSRLGRTYGRAEVTTAGDRSAEIEVRLAGEAPRAAGWTALIYGYDAARDCFWITPVDPATFFGLNR
jgi:hypothetical protein